MSGSKDAICAGRGGDGLSEESHMCAFAAGLKALSGKDAGFAQAAEAEMGQGERRRG